ncbi:hypothetical protein BST61_g10516 [Cercospora zeina]
MKSFIIAVAYMALASAAPVIIEPHDQTSAPNSISSRDPTTGSNLEVAHKTTHDRSIEGERREEGALADVVVTARDGTTEFDADAFYKDRRDDDALADAVVQARDGTTEFDADAFYKGRRNDAASGVVVETRDGTTEFDADAFYKG